MEVYLPMIEGTSTGDCEWRDGAIGEGDLRTITLDDRRSVGT